MKVLVLGATGFIGRALCFRLLRDGHQVVAISRNYQRASALLGADAQVAAPEELERALESCDAVVNLAGESIATRRWSSSRKEEIRDSRVGLTKRLVTAMATLESPPKVLISASAVGFFGTDRPGERLTESDEAGDDFLADVCREWERAAMAAEQLGARVCTPRFGIVLGLGGGFIAAARPVFAKRLGGRLGSGKQQVSWIHVADAIELIVTAIADDRYRGPINATAPNPISNSELTQALASALGTSAVIPAPGFMLRAVLGERAALMLGSCAATPQRALELGFTFRFPDVGEALTNLFDTSDIEFSAAGEVPASDYLAARKARYRLYTKTRIAAPLEEVFDFFSRAENLGAVTPPEMSFEITQKPAEISEGCSIDYRIGLGPIPMRWRTCMEVWQPGERFVDVQMRGPYRCWWHEHRFSSDGAGGTVMEDTVLYSPPLGPLGAIANRVFIEDKLRSIFAYRSYIMAARFPLASATADTELGRSASDARPVTP